ncbi:HEAT repeat domain-containing protein [Hyalangium rubrum]|uniref:HEAT repeat domain-containing protein n=1 Tax=Hyalangium rubrum TaxID=3103134 RepID=A0ABU5HK92_9BACT|nr:HEAT repeat domain-containing protein [Hyalangium sp. s54d21]MDY7233247.1 HEAT repeat domain-containing protein [Hyalangium sp. s54d21]
MASPQTSNETAAASAADPVVADKVELARNFTFHLLKGIKQIGMYRHNDSKFPEFLARAQEALAGYTGKHGPLSLKVEQQNFMLHNEPLFSEATPLPYKFFRDGIRQLIFRPGLTVEEMVTFTLIALSEPERGADDVLAQLWRAGLEHVEYVVVEGFSMEGASEEEVQIEVDKVVGYLYSRLKTSSEDYLRFARVNAEDLDAQMEGVEQIRGVVVGGTYATDTMKARLQKEIEEEENARLFPKLVSAVFQVVEGGVDDVGLLEELFVQLLDAMLIQDDYATINQMVLKLRALVQREDVDTSNTSRLLSYFLQKMGDEQRLIRMGESLKLTKPRNPTDIVRYLQVLDENSIITLLTVLETIEVPENRVLLSDVLANFAKVRPEPFVMRLESDKPQIIRDMVYILEKAQLPDRLKMFGKVLKGKNLVVKLEVMSIIARGHTPEARKLIAEMLQDPISQVRIQAARVLPEFDHDKATLDLQRVIRDPNFEKKTQDERAAFYAALGSTGTTAALSYLTAMLAVKPSLLNKKKVLDDKLLAIQGLAGAGNIQSYKLLQGVVEDKSQPTEVLTAARKAMYQTKKALFGDTASAEEA